jgi:hypothetical protein
MPVSRHHVRVLAGTARGDVEAPVWTGKTAVAVRAADGSYHQPVYIPFADRLERDRGPMSVILPEHLQAEVASYPETRMGVHEITVVLRDGRAISGVHVAWASEVVKVDGHSAVPFTTEEIAEVYDASGLA